jgi:hypothetical protein
MELAMTNRVRDIDPSSEHGDGVAPLLERCSMRGSVYAARHSANNRDAGSHEGTGQHPCCPLAVCCRVSGSDDCDPWLGERRASADGEDHRWRHRQVHQFSGILGASALPSRDLKSAVGFPIGRNKKLLRGN